MLILCCIYINFNAVQICFFQPNLHLIISFYCTLICIAEQYQISWPEKKIFDKTRLEHNTSQQTMEPYSVWMVGLYMFYPLTLPLRPLEQQVLSLASPKMVVKNEFQPLISGFLTKLLLFCPNMCLCVCAVWKGQHLRSFPDTTATLFQLSLMDAARNISFNAAAMEIILKMVSLLSSIRLFIPGNRSGIKTWHGKFKNYRVNLSQKRPIGSSTPAIKQRIFKLVILGL